MEVSVSIIAHKHQGVLPGTYIGILSITDGLVYQHLGFVCISYREAAYGYILQLAVRIQSGSSPSMPNQLSLTKQETALKEFSLSKHSR